MNYVKQKKVKEEQKSFIQPQDSELQAIQCLVRAILSSPLGSIDISYSLMVYLEPPYKGK